MKRKYLGSIIHANPDYALWYGWSEMKQTLKEIETMAENMRKTRT